MARPWKVPGLDAKERLDVCLKQILLLRFREMWSYSSGTMKGKTTKPLHNMRVSARRLQAILKLFRKLFPKRKYTHQYEKLRGLIKTLGPVRQLDVSIDWLEKNKKLTPPANRKSVALLLARQERDRQSQRRNAVRTLKSLKRENWPESFQKFVSSTL